MKIKNMNTFCLLIGENCFWCKQECKEPYLETTCDFCEDQYRHWDKFCEVCWKFIKIENTKKPSQRSTQWNEKHRFQKQKVKYLAKAISFGIPIGTIENFVEKITESQIENKPLTAKDLIGK
ncbi:MAG: hypothetical protein PPFGHCPK_01379 (plasmid) [Spiroplasma endosymbiont of Drosophila atripex]|nr:MAG: hypothetical protein PPFGHCPK_01379 [Spiroplasma endosymbiont of Drosophila atripex]